MPHPTAQPIRTTRNQRNRPASEKNKSLLREQGVPNRPRPCKNLQRHHVHPGNPADQPVVDIADGTNTRAIGITTIITIISMVVVGSNRHHVVASGIRMMLWILQSLTIMGMDM